MKFKCFYEWNHLPDTSNALFLEGEKDSVFFSREWLENLSETALKFDQSLLLACVIEPDLNDEYKTKVLAILPLIKHDDNEWTSLNHTYTSLYSLLIVNDRQHEILECLAHGLSQQPVQRITLVPNAEDDNNLNTLQRMMETSGFTSNRYLQFYNWYHELEGDSFTEYMADRPSKLRNTIARKERKLKREQGYDIRLYAGDEVTQALPDYYAIYAASWKPKELYKHVIEGFVSKFASKNWIRLAILYIDNKPAATQLWFVVNKKASILKLAYDESWKQYSPGSILTHYLMEYVIDTDKVEGIDFLTGNDRYKQDWMTKHRLRWRVVFTRDVASINTRDLITNKIRQAMKGFRSRCSLGKNSHSI